MKIFIKFDDSVDLIEIELAAYGTTSLRQFMVLLQQQCQGDTIHTLSLEDEPPFKVKDKNDTLDDLDIEDGTTLLASRKKPKQDKFDLSQEEEWDDLELPGEEQEADSDEKKSLASPPETQKKSAELPVEPQNIPPEKKNLPTVSPKPANEEEQPKAPVDVTQGKMPTDKKAEPIPQKEAKLLRSFLGTLEKPKPYEVGIARSLISNLISQIDVPQNIGHFIKRFDSKAHLTPDDFHKFKQDLRLVMNKGVHDALVMITHIICFEIFSEFKAEVKTLVQGLQKGETDIDSKQQNYEKYRGLLNIWHLTQGEPLPTAYNDFDIADFVADFGEFIRLEIPLAINALIVRKRLPLKCYELTLDKPLYPFVDEITTSTPHSVDHLMPAAKVFPIARYRKLVAGDTGDHTLLALSAGDLYYLRNISCKFANSVLASLIADFIQTKEEQVTFFSSEVLLDNGITASKHLKEYAIPLNTFIKTSHYLKKAIIPGTGLLEEVLCYLGENDRYNAENYALSNNIDAKDCHWVKIDFNECLCSDDLNEKNYIRKSLFKSFYKAWQDEDYREDSDYIFELLETRLKLSILSEDLLRALSDRAVFVPDPEQQDLLIKKLVDRSNLALTLFLKHPSAKEFIGSKFNILEILLNESVRFIQTNFKEPQLTQLVASISKRIEFIRSQIKSDLGIKLSQVSSVATTTDLDSKNTPTLSISKAPPQLKDFFKDSTVEIKTKKFDPEKDKALLSFLHRVLSPTHLKQWVKCSNSRYKKLAQFPFGGLFSIAEIDQIPAGLKQIHQHLYPESKQIDDKTKINLIRAVAEERLRLNSSTSDQTRNLYQLIIASFNSKVDAQDFENLIQQYEHQYFPGTHLVEINHSSRKMGLSLSMESESS